MSQREFKLEIADQVATLALDRPDKVNAMGRNFTPGLNRALDAIEQNSSVRCVILTGTGRVFCGGGDLHEIMSPDPTDMDAELRLVRGYNRVAKRLYEFELPIIAAINGPAAGGGVGIALACDFAIASETARYDLAFHKLGLAGADVGVPWFLHRLIGPALTSYYLLTAGSIDAPTGLRLGLFAEVVPPERLMAAAHRAADAIVAAPEQAVRISKLSLRHGTTMELGANMEIEAYLQSYAFRSPGHKRLIGEYRARLSRKE